MFVLATIKDTVKVRSDITICIYRSIWYRSRRQSTATPLLKCTSTHRQHHGHDRLACKETSLRVVVGCRSLIDHVEDVSRWHKSMQRRNTQARERPRRAQGGKPKLLYCCRQPHSGVDVSTPYIYGRQTCRWCKPPAMYADLHSKRQ